MPPPVREAHKRGRAVARRSCMTPATHVLLSLILRRSETVLKRASADDRNHPHDQSPVCEEGGNCHLQMATVMTGHSFRRYCFDQNVPPHRDLGRSSQ
ncbi:hypothetical protein KCP71_14980 [Salmonella enterica subsp. enterica]|nr:hypothetical protein KCP71_14980 [Salmonella enterica subsp. enterica]